MPSTVPTQREPHGHAKNSLAVILLHTGSIHSTHRGLPQWEEPRKPSTTTILESSKDRFEEVRRSERGQHAPSLTRCSVPRLVSRPKRTGERLCSVRLCVAHLTHAERPRPPAVGEAEVASGVARHSPMAGSSQPRVDRGGPWWAEELRIRVGFVPAPCRGRMAGPLSDAVGCDAVGCGAHTRPCVPLWLAPSATQNPGTQIPHQGAWVCPVGWVWSYVRWMAVSCDLVTLLGLLTGVGGRSHLPGGWHVP